MKHGNGIKDRDDKSSWYRNPHDRSFRGNQPQHEENEIDPIPGFLLGQADASR
jgi:hypothetical protein